MIRRSLVVLLVLISALVAAPARADDFRPAYLQLTQQAASTYEVLWKVPALGENTVLRVQPSFPPGTAAISAKRRTYADGVAVQRWHVTVSGGLGGKVIEFTGLHETRVDVLARLVRVDGSVQLERISASDPEFRIKANVSAGNWEVIQTYSLLGIEHILTGFDHLCFVLALMMIVGFNRGLVWTVTAFTGAHSITLALATMGAIRVPGPPVEAIIALSIVFVASEVVQQQRGRPSLTARKPWLVAFAFGLLHGLGFAGALTEIGLPSNSIPLALLFFNIGVEIGQLFFIAAVFAATKILFHIAARASGPDLRRVALAPAYLIGGIASYWTIERISNFWG